MILSRKHITLLGIACSILLLSFSKVHTRAKFIQPKGWPKPSYNFSKNKITDEGVRLGRVLFYDPILSRDSTISCASCHLQYTAFTHSDHNLSHGIDGLKGTRNSGTLFNLAWSPSFMWDGGVNNLEVQPINPITSPVEMDSKLEDAIARLNQSPRYRTMFYKAFKDSIVTSQHLFKALAQFTLLLESYNSKYDKVMRKEKDVSFTPEEQNGYTLFKKNCASCHTEPLFTNHTFQNNGLPVDAELNDIGRMKITGNPADSLKFKVPSLRNIFVSNPYMHDGRFRSLEKVLNHYTDGIVHSATLAKELQTKITMNKREKLDVIAFLRTLSDKQFLTDTSLGFYFTP